MLVAESAACNNQCCSCGKQGLLRGDHNHALNNTLSKLHSATIAAVYLAKMQDCCQLAAALHVEPAGCGWKNVVALHALMVHGLPELRPDRNLHLYIGEMNKCLM